MKTTKMGRKKFKLKSVGKIFLGVVVAVAAAVGGVGLYMQAQPINHPWDYYTAEEFAQFQQKDISLSSRYEELVKDYLKNPESIKEYGELATSEMQAIDKFTEENDGLSPSDVYQNELKKDPNYKPTEELLAAYQACFGLTIDQTVECVGGDQHLIAQAYGQNATGWGSAAKSIIGSKKNDTNTVALNGRVQELPGIVRATKWIIFGAVGVAFMVIIVMAVVVIKHQKQGKKQRRKVQ